jgi:hypothetical protein
MSEKNDEGKKILNRDDVLGSEDIEMIDVEVPEWGGYIRLKTLSAAQAISFIELSQEQRAVILPKMVVESAVNLDGSPVFKSGDEHLLKGKSLRAFIRLQSTILEMNGLGEKAVVQAKNGSDEAERSASSTV